MPFACTCLLACLVSACIHLCFSRVTGNNAETKYAHTHSRAFLE